MTAYANLRNVLANAFSMDYYNNDNESLDMCDAIFDALNAYEDHIYDTCKTSSDFDNALSRIEKGIRKAAKTASKSNAEFIINVVADWCDASFYGIAVSATTLVYGD